MQRIAQLAAANAGNFLVDAAEQFGGLCRLTRVAVEKHHAHDICGGEPVIARLPQVDRHRNADPIDLAGRVVAAAKLVDRDEEVAEQPIIDRNLLFLRSRGKPSQQVAIDSVGSDTRTIVLVSLREMTIILHGESSSVLARQQSDRLAKQKLAGGDQSGKLRRKHLQQFARGQAKGSSPRKQCRVAGRQRDLGARRPRSRGRNRGGNRRKPGARLCRRTRHDVRAVRACFAGGRSMPTPGRRGLW